MMSRNPRTTRFRWIAAALSLVVATAFVTTKVVSDDKNPPKGKGQEMSPEMQKMFEQCQKLATPGPEHRRLASSAGAWNTVSKFWMDPDGPPSEGKGVSYFKVLLGGRWVMQEHEGSSDNGPFSGFGLTGYDNFKKKYITTWTDSMGTGLMVSEGTADATGKIITYTGQYDCPMTGKTKTARSVYRILSDSKHILEMYDTTPEGKEYKNLEVVYTRK